MAVIEYNGNAGSYAIGLIACSRHQTSGYLPTSKHRPKMDFINPVRGGPAIDYLRRELGYESSRYSRTYFKFWTSEQWTGHTALFVRFRGQAAFARGWVPQESALNYGRMIFGCEVAGTWADDLPMIDDPTCVSLEYDVDELTCLSLLDYWDKVKGEFTKYCFTVQGEGRCNCVWAATTVLRDFANFYGLPEIAGPLAKVRDCAQGKIMGQIMRGDLLLA